MAAALAAGTPLIRPGSPGRALKAAHCCSQQEEGLTHSPSRAFCSLQRSASLCSSLYLLERSARPFSSGAWNFRFCSARLRLAARAISLSSCSSWTCPRRGDGQRIRSGDAGELPGSPVALTHLPRLQRQALDLRGIVLQLLELLHRPVPQGVHPPPGAASCCDGQRKSHKPGGFAKADRKEGLILLGV